MCDGVSDQLGYHDGHHYRQQELYVIGDLNLKKNMITDIRINNKREFKGFMNCMEESEELITAAVKIFNSCSKYMQADRAFYTTACLATMMDTIIGSRY